MGAEVSKREMAVLVEGRPYKVTVTQRYDYDKPGRVYIWNEPAPSGVSFPDGGYTRKCDDTAAHARGEHDDRGCDPENDAQWRRYNRAEVTIQKEVAEQVFPGATFRFSRYAGCSCPCSPGLVVRDGGAGRLSGLATFVVFEKEDE